MTSAPRQRLPYRAAARMREILRNLLRFRWRPFWLRRRLAWACWGAGARADIGAGLSLGAGVRIFLLPGGELTLGERVRLCDGVTLVVHPGARLSIGAGTYVGPRCELYALQSIDVGADCLFAGEVTVIDHNHCFDLASPVREKQLESTPVRVEEGCWLATRAVVAAGAGIGRFSVIGAGAVVTGSVPSGSVAAGVPAQVVKTLE